MHMWFEYSLLMFPIFSYQLQRKTHQKAHTIKRELKLHLRVPPKMLHKVVAKRPLKRSKIIKFKPNKKAATRKRELNSTFEHL